MLIGFEEAIPSNTVIFAHVFFKIAFPVHIYIYTFIYLHNYIYICTKNKIAVFLFIMIVCSFKS